MFKLIPVNCTGLGDDDMGKMMTTWEKSVCPPDHECDSATQSPREPKSILVSIPRRPLDARDATMFHERKIGILSAIISLLF
jgi:hypothetical protein